MINELKDILKQLEGLTTQVNTLINICEGEEPTIEKYEKLVINRCKTVVINYIKANGNILDKDHQSKLFFKLKKVNVYNYTLVNILKLSELDYKYIDNNSTTWKDIEIGL